MKRRQFIALVIGTASCGPLPALAQTRSGEIVVEDAWARMPPDRPAEAEVYLTIVNQGSDSDRLIRAASDVADEVSIERTVWRGLTPKLDRVTNLTIRSGGQAVFAPGKYQITLRKLREPLSVGKSFVMTLTFAAAGRVEVRPKVTNQILSNRGR